MLHALDQVDDQGLEQVDQRQDIVAVKVLILEEVFEAADPEIGLERHEKEHACVNKAMVLAVVLHEERLDATVDLDELPQLVEDRLVEGEAERDLLEDLGRLARDQQDVRIDLGYGNCRLRVERILEDRVTLVNLLPEDGPEQLGGRFEIEDR